jgi:chromosome segregation ATPase
MSSDSPQLQRAFFGYRRASVRQLLAGRETMFRFAQERAQAAEAKAEELQAELEAARAELVAQTEAAGSAHAETRAELEEATEALREQTEHVAAVDARLSELQAELAEARHAAQQHADAMRERASVQVELETARTELAARTEQALSAEARILELQAELEAARAEPAERTGEPETAPMAEAEDLSLMLDAAERGVTGIMERARHAYEDQLAQADLVREAIQSDIERFGDWQGHVEPLIRSIQQGIETARGRIIRIPDQIREAVDSMTDAMMAVSDSLDRLATLPGPLSLGPPPGAEESGAADTVIRLKESDPSTRHTPVPPSDVPRPEHQEEGGADAEAEDRTEPDHITTWGPFRNRGR